MSEDSIIIFNSFMILYTKIWSATLSYKKKETFIARDWRCMVLFLFFNCDDNESF